MTTPIDIGEVAAERLYFAQTRVRNCLMANAYPDSGKSTVALELARLELALAVQDMNAVRSLVEALR